MKRSKTLLRGVLVAAIAVPCIAHEPLTLASLKDRSAADKATPEGRAYLNEFFTNPWMLALDSAFDQCEAATLRSAPLEEFEIGLIIGDNGYPSDALVGPENEGMKCVADRLRATGFIKPPHDGFAIYLDYKRTEPGTEHRSPAAAPETSSGSEN